MYFPLIGGKDCPSSKLIVSFKDEFKVEKNKVNIIFYQQNIYCILNSCGVNTKFNRPILILLIYFCFHPYLNYINYIIG